MQNVLEARSAIAQAQYALEAVLGAEQIARGDLLTALGASTSTSIRVQPLSEVPTPESVLDIVEKAISRALEQRPALQAQFAGHRRFTMLFIAVIAAAAWIAASSPRLSYLGFRSQLHFR